MIPVAWEIVPRIYKWYSKKKKKSVSAMKETATKSKKNYSIEKILGQLYVIQGINI